jgi:hypothetical protein
MIAIRNETVDRILAIAAGIRRTLYFMPPVERKRTFSQVASHCTFPVTEATF